ncbi:hypothetical protein JX266_004419 [Neoarthrinium moseri]|nr:hypothetical protein JX266_004419 [Neoarthrinium moseri]
MAGDLKQHLTPELFKFMGIRERAWPVLKALSQYGLDQVPDMMEFLPPPEDPDFPSQALGLQLVLDQAPRDLLEGIHNRWTFDYFGDIALRFARQLQALPPHLNPAAWARWRDSASLDYFIFVRLWFGAPLVHHEATPDEAVAFTEETRRLVEQTLGTRDPHRDQPEKRWDLHGFPRMLTEKGPSSPCGAAEGAFWIACLLDVHRPPLDRFGRYPYRNGFLGRVDTPEEEAWMEKAPMFAVDPDVRRRIRDDVEAGRWTPLDEGTE